MQGNPYKLDFHEWYPFEKAIGSISYRSFHEHNRTFDNMFDWFYAEIDILGYDKKGRAEIEGQEKFD